MQPIIFPGLGLKFTINPVAFTIFGLKMHWYGIIIGSGFLLGLFLALRDAGRFKIDQEDILDLLILAAPLAVVGARLYYVIFRWPDYANDPAEIFKIWHGGLAIYGAVLTAIIVTYFFARKRGINVWELLDFLVPYLPLGQAIGRWGNFVNQEAYGVPTDLPWRMEIFDPQTMQRIAVHPTFLYESLWNFALFFFLLWFRKRKKIQGEVFVLYLGLYGFARFFIEGLRTDSLYLGPLRISQVLAGVFFLVCMAVFVIRRLKAAKEAAE